MVKRVHAEVKEVTVVSTIKFFGYESRESGKTTGSDLAVKFEIPPDTDEDSLKAFMLEVKWELDHTLLEMEVARGSVTRRQFKTLSSQLETNYTALLEDFEGDEEDGDDD